MSSISTIFEKLKISANAIKKANSLITTTTIKEIKEILKEQTSSLNQLVKEVEALHLQEDNRLTNIETSLKQLIEDRVATIDTAPIESSLKSATQALDKKISELNTSLKNAPKSFAAAASANIPKAKPSAKNTTSLKEPKKTFSLVLKNNDPRIDEDPVKVFKKVHKSCPLKNPPSFRKLSNNTCRVECFTEEDKKTLIEKINSISSLKYEEERKRRPLVILKGIPADVEEDTLIAEIVEQNSSLKTQLSEVGKPEKCMRVLFRRKNHRHDGNRYNAVIEVTSAIRTAIIKEGRVVIGYNRIHAEDYSSLIQCRNCQGFGHLAAKCNSSVKCAHCAEGHRVNECPDTKVLSKTKCVNCDHHNSTKTKEGDESSKTSLSTSHRATSLKCPRLIFMTQRAHEKTEYGC